MADRAKKISELTATTSTANTDYMLVVANTGGVATTKRIAVNNFISSAVLTPTGVSHSNTALTLKSANGQLVNIISNNFVQMQYNANVSVSANTTTDSNRTYVTSTEVGVETYVSSTLKSGVYAKNDGTVQIRAGTTTFTFSNTVPSIAASSGTAGQIAFDNDFVYICVATNTWKRAALSTW